METEEQVKKMMSLKNATSSKNKSVTNDKKMVFDKPKGKDELNIIIKSDVQGSNEALKMVIDKIEHEEVEAKIILSDIGMINKLM